MSTTGSLRYLRDSSLYRPTLPRRDAQRRAQLRTSLQTRALDSLRSVRFAAHHARPVASHSARRTGSHRSGVRARRQPDLGSGASANHTSRARRFVHRNGRTPNRIMAIQSQNTRPRRVAQARYALRHATDRDVHHARRSPRAVPARRTGVWCAQAVPPWDRTRRDAAQARTDAPHELNNHNATSFTNAVARQRPISKARCTIGSTSWGAVTFEGSVTTLYTH